MFGRHTLTMPPDCFDLLELPRDADARAIKRAYAAKLKTTRPDEDPKGFQSLNDAYRQALAHANAARSQGDDVPPAATFIDLSSFAASTPAPARPASGPADSEPPELEPAESTPPATRPPVPRPPRTAPNATQHVDDDAGASFDLDTCLALAETPNATALTDWLNRQPELWSLQGKQAIATRLFETLVEYLPPIPASQFDVLTAYFGYSEFERGIDPIELMWLRDELDAVWHVRAPFMRKRLHDTWDGSRQPSRPMPPGIALLRGRIAAGRGKDFHQARLAAQQQQRDDDFRRRFVDIANQVHPCLTRPGQWFLDLCLMLLPGYPSSVGRFLRSWAFPDEPLPAPIREDRARFWLDASDLTRLSAARGAVAVARCVAIVAAYAMFQVFRHVPASSATWPLRVLDASLQVALLIAAWLGWVSLTTMYAWQRTPTPPTQPLRFLHGYARPLSACAALACALPRGLPHIAVSAALAFAMIAATLLAARHDAQQDPRRTTDGVLATLILCCRKYPVLAGILSIPVLVAFFVPILDSEASDDSAQRIASALLALASLIYIIKDAIQRRPA